MNKKEGNYKNKNSLLGTMLVFFTVVKYYSNRMFEGTPIPVAKICMIITGALALFLIVNNIKKYNVYHLAMFGLLCVQFIFTRSTSLIYVYILALALLNLEMKEIMKTYIITSLILFIVFLVLNILNIMPTKYVHNRNDFGFGNPNGAYISFFVIYVAYMYLKFDKFEKKDLVLLVVFPLMVYMETETRTGFLTVVGAFVLTMILQRVDINKKHIKIAFASVPILISGMSVYIAYMHRNSIFWNKLLSHRPLYWYKYLANEEYGLRLMGYNDNIRDIVFRPRVPLDSGYILTLYTAGIVVFIVLMLLYAYAIYKLCSENKKAEVMLILSVLVYAFAESMLLDLGTNITFVFIAYALSKLGDRKKYNMR